MPEGPRPAISDVRCLAYNVGASKDSTAGKLLCRSNDCHPFLVAGSQPDAIVNAIASAVANDAGDAI